MKIIKVFIVVIWICACNKSSTPPATTTTSLRIVVKDSNDNLLSGASVKLFLTETDMNAGVNQIGSTVITDNSGAVLFDSLQPVTYFFDAASGCMNNRLAVFPFKTFDSTIVPLLASRENLVTTQVLPSGSIKYVNHSGNAYALSWLERGGTDIPGGVFLVNLNNNDSVSFQYEPTGEYKTKIAQLGGSFNSVRTDTLKCGDALTIQLP